MHTTRAFSLALICQLLQHAVASMQDELQIRADMVFTETIAIDRFGSMCAASQRTFKPTTLTDFYYTTAPTVSPITLTSSTSPTSSASTQLPIPSILSSSPSSSAAVTSAPPTTSSSASSSTLAPTTTPLPYQTLTHCLDPVCPLLDNSLCLDASGATYGIICNASLTGLIAFPPKRLAPRTALSPRTYTAAFADCLALCDQEGGCHGVDWSAEYQNCLLYGQVLTVQARNGSVAARRIGTYGTYGSYRTGP